MSLITDRRRRVDSRPSICGCTSYQMISHLSMRRAATYLSLVDSIGPETGEADMTPNNLFGKTR